MLDNIASLINTSEVGAIGDSPQILSQCCDVDCGQKCF